MEPLYYLIGVAASTLVSLIAAYVTLRTRAKEKERVTRERLAETRKTERELVEVGVGNSDTVSTKIEVTGDTRSTAIKLPAAF